VPPSRPVVRSRGSPHDARGRRRIGWRVVPELFELDAVRHRLQTKGVSENMVGPTITFMRLIVPLLIRDAGVERMVGLFDHACAHEWNRPPQPAWAKSTAKNVLLLAESWLDEYREARDNFELER
jgi:hypothetical protein